MNYTSVSTTMKYTYGRVEEHIKHSAKFCQ